MPDGPSSLWVQAQWANVSFSYILRGFSTLLRFSEISISDDYGGVQAFRDFFLWCVIYKIKVECHFLCQRYKKISAAAMKTISESADLRRNQYHQHEDFNALDADNCSGYWIKWCERNSPKGNHWECGHEAKTKFKDGKNWNFISSDSEEPKNLKSHLFFFLLSLTNFKLSFTESQPTCKRRNSTSGLLSKLNFISQH